MRMINRVSVGLLTAALLFSLSGIASAATQIDLLTASDFAVLAGSGITFAGAVNSSTVTGDIGTFPTTDITGIVNVVLDGVNHAGDAVTQGAKNDLVIAYDNAVGQPCSQDLTGQDLGAMTLTPGVYCFDTSAQLTGSLTLDAQGDPDAVFIFKIGSTLTTASASSIVLADSAQACHVFWQVGSSSTLGTTTDFKGTIMALTSITLNTGAKVEGRALARNGAVTLDANIINKATCAVTPTPSSSNINNKITVIKYVINDNSGTAKYSDFPLFVNGNPVSSGQGVITTPGIYKVTETSSPKYKTTFSGDCNAQGQIDHGGLNTHDSICIVTNDDIGLPAIVAPVPPLIDVVKVPSPLALPAGPGSVTYTYTLRNTGTVKVTDVTMIGDTCSPIVLASGDTNNDSNLDINETWVYRCQTTLAQTHTNTVVATGWANGISATDIASATVIVGEPVVPPLIHVTKTPSPLVLPAGGGTVTYTKKVSNPGTVALSNVRLTDDKCVPVKYISGDANGDSKLDPEEIWNYTCQANIIRTTANTAIAEGEANGLLARDFAIATVVVAAAVPALPNTGFSPKETSALLNIFLLAGFLLILTGIFVVLKRRKS
ncbi:MAG: ice-binding family protein [Patescibacteria group bacterium]